MVVFAEKDESESKVFEIETLDTTPHHWTPPQTKRSFTQVTAVESKTAPIDPVITNTDLHKIFTSATNFTKSPAEVETHRKVDLEDKKITEESKVKFHKLCDKFDNIILKGSKDIGKTLLIKIDIDTGNSPPITSRPYTLPLKHHKWVKKEIETLERAGIINWSISAWASPVIIVPKKYAPGEPPTPTLQRRMW